MIIYVDDLLNLIHALIENGWWIRIQDNVSFDYAVRMGPFNTIQF